MPTERSAPKYWFLLPIAALVAFFAITSAVAWMPERLAPVELPILDWFNGLRAAGLDPVVVGLTQLGDPEVIWPFSITIFLWLAFAAKAQRAALAWGMTIAAAAAINTSVKWAIGRYRPTDGVYDVAHDGVAAFSFPSGHATVNLALYGVLAILLSRDLAPRYRVIAGFGLIVFGFSIAVSRVYLGAHWPSDVLASAFLAFAIVYTMQHAYIGSSRLGVDPGKFGAAVAVCLLVFGGLNIMRNHGADAARYTPAQAPEVRQSD